MKFKQLCTIRILQLLLLFASISVSSQNIKDKELLIPYRDGKLWGLCDTLGVVKIKPFADEISDFKINKDFAGKYIVRVNDIQKVINHKGEILLENKDYDSISIGYFDNGIEIYKRKKVGVFLNGKEFIPCIYDRIHETRNGSYEVVKNGKSGIINSLGKLIVPVEYKYVDYSEGSGDKADMFIWKLKKESGKTQEYLDAKIDTGEKYSQTELPPPLDFEEKPRQKMNEVQRNNYFEISKKYDGINDVVDGRLVIVENSNGSGESRKVGVVNLMTKDVVINLDYDAIIYTTKENGKVIFELIKNKKARFADEDLKQIPPNDFDNSINYNESIYFIKKNNKWGAKIFHTIYPFIPMKYESIDFSKTIKIKNNWSFNLFEVGLEDGRKGFVGENGIEYFKD